MEWYDSDGFSGSDGSDGSDGFDGFDGFDGVWCRMVQELRWLKSWASTETEKSLGTSLRTTTAPRVSNGSISLRRVEKFLELELKDLPTKLLKNELKDCPTKLV